MLPDSVPYSGRDLRSKLHFYQGMGAGAGALSESQTEKFLHEVVLYCADGNHMDFQDHKTGQMLKKIVKMRKAGVPLEACVQRAQIKESNWNGLSDEDVQRFLRWCEARGKISAADIAAAFPKSSSLGGIRYGDKDYDAQHYSSMFKTKIEVLEKYRVLLGGKAPVSVVVDYDISQEKLALIREAFAGSSTNIFHNLCSRQRLKGMLKGLKVMHCNAATCKNFCLRWRDLNCENDPVDMIAVDLWLEICLPAWKMKSRYTSSHGESKHK